VNLWPKVVAFLSMVVAILFYRGKADRAERKSSERDAKAAEAGLDMLNKANKVISKADKAAKVKEAADVKKAKSGTNTLNDW